MRVFGFLVAAAVFTAAVTARASGDTAPGAIPAPAVAGGSTDSAAASAILDSARARVAAGDTKGAIDQLAPYVAKHPGDAAAGRLLGDLYFRIPDYSRAEKIWRGLLALDADDRETHSRLGSLYAVLDRISDAISEFQKSLPNRSGYTGLVTMHQRAGDLPSYLTRLETQTREHPFDAGAWTELGQARLQLRQFDSALEALNRSVGLRPAACSARLDLAYLLVDMRRIDPAIAHLKSCLQNDPAYYPALVNLGEAYLEKADAATARPYFDRALNVRAEGSEALVDIGYIYDMTGDWKTATGYYNRAVRSDPMRPEAYINLGYDYNEHRFFPLAEAAFIKGLSVASDDGRLHYLLAVTYNLQGKISLARDEYRHALSSQEPDVVRAARAELALLPPS